MEIIPFHVDPLQLRAEAERESPRRSLRQYSDAIRVLKDEKGFSFREIAVWLQDRQVKADHNAVWRTYVQAVRVSGSGKSVERTEHYEQNQAQDEAMPWA